MTDDLAEIIAACRATARPAFGSGAEPGNFFGAVLALCDRAERLQKVGAAFTRMAAMMEMSWVANPLDAPEEVVAVLQSILDTIADE